MALDSVLITGCSAGGLGSAIAVAFQKRGLHVFATARDVSKMKHLSGIENITLLPLDVTSPSSIAEAAELVQKSEVGGGKLKYLVHPSSCYFPFGGWVWDARANGVWFRLITRGRDT